MRPNRSNGMTAEKCQRMMCIQLNPMDEKRFCTMEFVFLISFLWKFSNFYSKKCLFYSFESDFHFYSKFKEIACISKRKCCKKRPKHSNMETCEPHITSFQTQSIEAVQNSQENIQYVTRHTQPQCATPLLLPLQPLMLLCGVCIYVYETLVTHKKAILFIYVTQT